VNKDESLLKREEAIALYEIYGPLLSKAAKKRFADYYYEDCSLSEIGELEGRSRAAIHASLRESVEKMRKLEEQLGWLSRREKTLGLLDGLKKHLEGDKEALEALKELSDAI